MLNGVRVCVFSYLSQLAVLHTEPQALSVWQGVAPLGCGSLAGGGRGAVAHRPPSRYHHLAAGLVLIQSTLAGINDPARARYMQVNYYIKHLATFFQASFFSSWNFSYEQQMHHSLSDRCGLEQAAEWKPTSDASRRMKRLSSLSWLSWLTAGSQQLVWATAWGLCGYTRLSSGLCVFHFSQWGSKNQSSFAVRLCWEGPDAWGPSLLGQLQIFVCVLTVQIRLKLCVRCLIHLWCRI